MKRKPERKHVRIYTTTRKDTGRPQHLVRWVSPAGQKRFSFSDLVEANTEADRVEALLEQGFQALAVIPRDTLLSLNYFLEQLPEDDGQTMLNIFQSHFKRARTEGSATVAELGDLFKKTRSSVEDFSARQVKSVRQHINAFSRQFGPTPIAAVTNDDIKSYLDKVVGGAPKTRKNHLITLACFFRWARDVGANGTRFLPYGQPTAACQVISPKVKKAEHIVYSPEEFTRILAVTPKEMVVWMVLGQFAGIRAEERLRLTWEHWHCDEDNKIVCSEDITKTDRRRRVDVLPNLAEWLLMFRSAAAEPMCQTRNVYNHTGAIAKAAGLRWEDNALRAGFASYHLAMFDNAPLTARNDGHSVQELQSTYLTIRGVTQARAAQMFSITPASVLEYAATHGMPRPAWAPVNTLQAVA